MKKKQILFGLINILRIFTIILLLCSSSLRAILDGRVNPIYIDTVYTFTNGEWARGSVFFRKGFDLPIGGTVYLGIDGGFVNGPIQLNGATLSLQQAITLKNLATIVAPGFIKGTTGKVESVLIKYECRGLWAGAGSVKFITTGMRFQAISNSAIIDTGNVTIDFRTAGDIYFLGGRIILRNLLTSNTNSSFIWFFNTDLVITDNISSFNQSDTYFQGKVSLTTLQPLAFQNLNIKGFSDLILYPGNNLTLNNLDIPFVGTRLGMRQSSLDFVSTSTALLRMITPYTHNLQGTVAVEGKCKISSSTNNILIFDKYAKLELLDGARLIINEGDYLLIE